MFFVLHKLSDLREVSVCVAFMNCSCVVLCFLFCECEILEVLTFERFILWVWCDIIKLFDLWKLCFQVW